MTTIKEEPTDNLLLELTDVVRTRDELRILLKTQTWLSETTRDDLRGFEGTLSMYAVSLQQEIEYRASIDGFEEDIADFSL